MARDLTPPVKLARREGIPIHPKSVKALTKRNYIPGQHGLSRRGKMSEYGTQLREKQKVKRTYGILERQFRNYFEKAAKKEGVTGEILLMMLEKRLDNVIFRFGLATSRGQARQLVTHGHIQVNGKKLDIPSYEVKVGDKITVKPKSLEGNYFKAIKESLKNQNTTVSWLLFDSKSLSGGVKSNPPREELDHEVSEQLIVEFYSR